ncbi:MAG: DNA-binding response regulator [Calditrichaeota bacterium]|nr:MAG: DNA-binding response regulator [Calditrichota bacterium]
MLNDDKIRAVLVDDEELARKLVREYLSDYPQVEIVAECSSGREAVKRVNALRPDLLFLDIQMPELNGFQVLERLERIPCVIFSTAYDQYAIKAFEVNALDYLLKPYDRERFDEAMQRAFERLRSRQPAENLVALLQALQAERDAPHRFWVRTAGCLKPLKPEAIDWIEAMDDYACLHVGPERHLVSQTMKELEAKLDPRTFMRIHRSTIVNLDRIKEVRPVGDGSFRVFLKDGTRLSLSRSQAKKLKKYIV